MVGWEEVKGGVCGVMEIRREGGGFDALQNFYRCSSLDPSTAGYLANFGGPISIQYSFFLTKKWKKQRLIKYSFISLSISFLSYSTRRMKPIS